MKNIKFLIALIGGFALFIGCADTKDCICEVTVADKSASVNKAATRTYSVTDWDGNCSDITADDIPGWNGSPCKEN